MANKYNTGNAVGSTDLRDLYDNASNLDDALNGPADTWIDRKGVTRKSWEGFLADGSIPSFTTYAEASSAVVSLNRQVQVIGDAGTHTDPVTGDVVSNSGTFIKVVAGLQFRRADTLAEKADRTEVASGLATKADSEVVSTELGKITLMSYEGDGPAIPVVTDHDLKVLLGVYSDSGKLIADIGSDSIMPALAETFPAESATLEYTVGDVVSAIGDRSNSVLLGVDTSDAEVIGRLPAAIQNPLIPTAYKLYAPALKGGWVHYLHYGQSLSVGAYAVEWSTHQGYSNLTFGAGLKATKAGSTGDNPGTDTTKALIEDDISNNAGGAQRGESGVMAGTDEICERQVKASKPLPVLFGSAAGRVGYSITQLNFGSAWVQVLKDQIDQAKARATEAGKPWDMLPLVFIQGEADTAMDRETYKGYLVQFLADLSAYAKRPGGRKVAMLLNQTPASAVFTAQFQLCDDPESGFFHGTAIYDLTSVDGQHLTAFGYHKMGRRLGRQQNDVINGLRPRCIWPKGAVRRGNVIRWSFDVPTAPLVADTTNIPAITNRGFRVTVDGAQATINSLVIDGADVVFTLSTTPADDAVVQVRYGMDYQIGGNGWGTQNRGGNMIDSTPDTFWYGGTQYPLPYVMPHCYRNVINLKTGANGQ